MSSQIAHTITTSVPIVLLIAVGALVRRAGIVSQQGIEEIKALLVNVALPSVLFVAFLTIEFEGRYIGIFVFMPVVLFLLLGLGYACALLPGAPRPVPYLMTGFEFGMLGISLFGTAYGMNQVGVISVVGLTHELFIWFVFVTLLRAAYGMGGTMGETVKSFLTSPVIVAILVGTALNLAGLGGWFTTAVAPAALIGALEMLGSIVGPLILLVIGYGMRLTVRGVTQASPLVLLRLAVVAAIGIGVAPWVVEDLLQLPPIFTHAVFTFLILPPPFIVPLYIPADRSDDLAYSNNVLSVYTLFSIVVFLLYFAVNPGA
jgi:predicted permease